MIFLEEPKKGGAEPSKPDGGAGRGIPAPIHLVRRGDYLCKYIFSLFSFADN